MLAVCEQLVNQKVQKFKRSDREVCIYVVIGQVSGQQDNGEMC